MTDLTLDQLTVELHQAATVSTMGKVDRIIDRAAVEIREHWKDAATDFPSPTLRRDKYYAIDFPGIKHGATTSEATIGSDDPLLAVIESGGAHHAPQNLGHAALEFGAKFAGDALRLIDPLSGKQ